MLSPVHTLTQNLLLLLLVLLTHTAVTTPHPNSKDRYTSSPPSPNTPPLYPPSRPLSPSSSDPRHLAAPPSPPPPAHPTVSLYILSRPSGFWLEETCTALAPRTCCALDTSLFEGANGEFEIAQARGLARRGGQIVLGMRRGKWAYPCSGRAVESGVGGAGGVWSAGLVGPDAVVDGRGDDGVMTGVMWLDACDDLGGGLTSVFGGLGAYLNALVGKYRVAQGTACGILKEQDDRWEAGYDGDGEDDGWMKSVAIEERKRRGKREVEKGRGAKVAFPDKLTWNRTTYERTRGGDGVFRDGYGNALDRGEVRREMRQVT
ncbi:MAG: hypothetical protein M1833_001943 [Piccolia ochrophora]|nr:MAG: hypothetical protein M1833_001943 [Piccolia ochrophora]